MLSDLQQKTVFLKMSVKLFISIILFTFLINTVVSEATAVAYAHASNHHSSAGTKHEEKGRLNLTERMEELKAHIKAMKEEHLKHRMEMFNKHKNWGQQHNTRKNHKTSPPHKEVNGLHVAEPVTTEAISTYPINSTQTKEPVTEQWISTTTEQIFHIPEVEKSHNVKEEPNDILTTSSPMPTEESTLATIMETVTEKSTLAMPPTTVTTECTPTMTVTEKSSVVTTVGTVPTAGSTVGEISVVNSTTESYSFMNLNHSGPEEQTAAQDFTNLSVSPTHSNEDSSYDDFDIDIRDGAIGE